MNKAFLSFLLIFTESCSRSVNSLDLESEIERQKQVPFCGAIQPAPHVDSSWIRSTKVWYFVYWTKLELLLTSKAFLSDEEFKNKTQEQAIKYICFRMNFNTGDSNGYGIQVPSNITSLFKIHYNPVRHGVIDWECADHYVLTTYIIMTDNKTYAVGVDVFPDGTRGGFVMTTETNENMISEDQVMVWKRKFIESGLEEGDFIHTPLECNKKLDEDPKLNKDPESQMKVGDMPEEDRFVKSEGYSPVAP